MAMDKTAQLPRSRRRGLNYTQEQILLLVNELRFLTRKAIWRILYAKGSFTHAGETLKKLADEGYLTRVGLPHARGTSELVYTLTKQGAFFLRALGVEDASWWYRPMSQASFSLLTHNVAIGQFHIALRLFVRERDGWRIIQTRTCYQMERDPPRLPTIGDGRQVEAAVIPDSWVHLELPDGDRAALWIEIDHGTESKPKYMQMVRERRALISNGQYEKYFATPSAQLCYLTIGPPGYRHKRAQTLCAWTGELLTGMRLTAWADVFRFSTIGEDISDTNALFLNAVWQKPYANAPVALFTSPQGEEKT